MQLRLFSPLISKAFAIGLALQPAYLTATDSIDLPQDHQKARNRLYAVLNNGATTPQNRAKAQLYLAEMDHFGLGGPKDHQKACNLISQGNYP